MEATNKRNGWLSNIFSTLEGGFWWGVGHARNLLSPITKIFNETSFGSYLNETSVRRNASGYFFGDLPVLFSGIFAGNWEKIKSGIFGLLQSVFYAIDKGADPIDADKALSQLANSIEQSKEKGQFTALITEQEKKSPVATAVDVVRTHGQELGSAMMVGAGVKMIAAAFNYKEKDGSHLNKPWYKKVIWGDLFNGLLNVAGFGINAATSIMQKYFGFEFGEKKEAEIGELKEGATLGERTMHYLKRVQKNPNILSQRLVQGSSIAGALSGAQLIHKGLQSDGEDRKEKISSGISQLSGSTMYYIAEENVKHFGTDEEKKYSTVGFTAASEAAGKRKKVDASTVYQRAIDELKKNGMIEDGQKEKNDATLAETAKMFASMTGVAGDRMDKLTKSICAEMQGLLEQQKETVPA